jgi:threonine dehydrogenase-like Zn-dependent dehydrogenase
MTELVVDEERYMQVLPQQLRDVGVLIEPLTITEKALRQIWDVQERLPWGPSNKPNGDGDGLNALVLGAGPVGMLACLAFLVRGFNTFLYSNSAAGTEKALWVESVGAHYLSSKAMTREQVREHIGRIDLIYEATGAPRLSFEMLEILAVNGVCVLTGLPGKGEPIPLNASELMRSIVMKNQLVLGTVNASSSAFQQAIADLTQFDTRWPEPLRKLVTGRYSPDQIKDVLLEPASGIKRVVQFAES